MKPTHKVTKVDGIKYLQERYKMQAQKFPLLTTKISLTLYIKRNLSQAIKNLSKMAKCPFPNGCGACHP